MLRIVEPFLSFWVIVLMHWKKYYIRNNIFNHWFALKETLQLILRKIHKMRFFLWLSVFLLHRWKYKLSENNTILKLKITFLSQKLMFFYGLGNKYCCYLLSLSWHMRRKRKHYQHGLQRGKRTVWRPRNITDSARKRLKRAQDIILIHNTIYLGDQDMNDCRKWNKNYVKRFPTYVSNFISPSVAQLQIMTWNYVLIIVNL